AVALIAYDQPHPQPLNAMREISANFAVALVLSPQRSSGAIASLDVSFVNGEGISTLMIDSALESVRAGIPAARSLPLLGALARGAKEEIILEYLDGSHLRVAV